MGYLRSKKMRAMRDMRKEDTIQETVKQIIEHLEKQETFYMEQGSSRDAMVVTLLIDDIRELFQSRMDIDERE